MPEPFGAFGWICESLGPSLSPAHYSGQHAPLPQCNLFFNQLYNDDNSNYLPTLFPRSSDFFVNYSIVRAISLCPATADRYQETDNTPFDNNVLAAVGDAGTGVGANCEIPHVGHRGSIGDVPLIVLSAVSILASLGLWVLAGRRKAAVGRTELRLFLLASPGWPWKAAMLIALQVYALHSAFQIVTMSSLIQQGTPSVPH